MMKRWLALVLAFVTGATVATVSAVTAATTVPPIQIGWVHAEKGDSWFTLSDQAMRDTHGCVLTGIARQNVAMEIANENNGNFSTPVGINAEFHFDIGRLPQCPTPPTTIAPTTTTTTTIAPVSGPRPFSNASPFNTPTSASAKWVDDPLLHAYWWIDNDAAQIVYVKSTDSTSWRLVMPTYIAAAWHRNRPAQTFTVSGPATLAAGTDTDHVLVLVEPDGTYYDMWEAVVNASAKTVTPAAWATGNINTGPGAGTLSNNDGVRAANFSWAAGLITNDDIAAGKIDHALVVALDGPRLKSGNSYIAPATAGESTGDGPIVMGTKIGIPSSAQMPSNLTSIGQMVFHSLQTYGAFVGDYTGGYPQFYAQHGVPDDAIGRLVNNWDWPQSDFQLISPLLRELA